MSVWRGKRVFVTGHTGFKGGWLSLWLQALGAEVAGFALAPPTEPNLFTLARVGDGVRSTIGDVRDLESVRRAMHDFQPELILHLAAQPLVRESYAAPIDTFITNAIGSANVLEAARSCASLRAALVITTDKCYENVERREGYREDEPLGGHDPYSASKACAEIVVASYRRSFFAPEGRVAVATARAGNVIGGGDWARDRLIPDVLAAFAEGRSVELRNPEAVRPWQHVLEPLQGYITLCERLLAAGDAFAEAWNFGPRDEDARTVRSIVETMAARRGVADGGWRQAAGEHPHEAQLLRLDWSKARERLGWRPSLTLDEALSWTLDWRAALDAGEDMRRVTLAQIAAYAQLAQGEGSGS